MRYLFAVLLLAGCASPPDKELDPVAQAKKDASIKESCDFTVGPPRDSPAYLTCMEYVAADMK